VIQDSCRRRHNVYCFSKFQGGNMRSWSFVLCAAFVFGCGDGNSGPGGAAQSELAAQVVCDQLLMCANEQNPSQFGMFFPVFGTGGTCWQSQGEAQCKEACMSAMQLLYQKGGSRYSACNYCESSATCGYKGVVQLVCNLRADANYYTRHKCVQCASDADCPSVAPVCKDTGECRGS
jgi:hypothetical protein